jgi:hypothetical protein
MATTSKLGRGELRPMAAPTDRFTQQDSAGAKLSQVARALGSVSPEVARLADQIDQVQKEKQREEGATLGQKLALEGLSEAEALRKGLIKPTESKTFQIARQRASAQQKALVAGREFATFMENAKKDETDESVITQKAEEFRAAQLENLADASEEERNAFLRMYMVQENNVLLNVSYTIGQNQVAKFERDIGANIANGIAIERARQEEVGGEPLAPLATRMSSVFASQREMLYNGGIRGERANAILIQTVADVAVSNGDPEVLEYLLHSPTGPEGTTTFARTPAYAAQIMEAYDRARSVKWRREEDEQRAKTREATGILQQMQAAMIAWRGEGRNVSLFDTTEWEERLAALDPAFAGRAREEAAGMAQAQQVRESAITMDAMIPLVYRDRIGLSTLLGMRDRGQLTADDFMYWQDRIVRRDSDSWSYKQRSAEGIAAFQPWARRIENREGQLIGRFLSPRIRTSNATNYIRIRDGYVTEFQFQWDDWLDSNPNATEQQAREASQRIARELHQRMEAQFPGITEVGDDFDFELYSPPRARTGFELTPPPNAAGIR